MDVNVRQRVETLKLLKHFHERLLHMAATLRFDKRDLLHMHQVALYGTLLELTGCMIQLVEHDGRTGVPSLFRAFLEAAVELRNLSRDSGYIEYIHASYEDQWLKVLEEAKKGANRYLAKIAAMPDLDAQIKDHERRLTEFSSRGIRPLSVYKRFERADMVEEYRSLYNFLSCDTHSNTRALISRHVELDGRDFEVVYYKDEPVESFLPTLDSTAGLLIEATQSIHESFKSESLTEVRKLREELITVRARYVA
jgi:hypothetical protein